MFLVYTLTAQTRIILARMLKISLKIKENKLEFWYSYPKLSDVFIDLWLSVKYQYVVSIV